MGAADPLGADPAVCDFVAIYLRDVERGGARPLAEYLARFPAHADAVAREYLALQGGGAPPAAAGHGAAARVGPYRLLRRLGQGGQGVVHLAEHEQLGRRVALKVLAGMSGLSAARVARLRREAQALARLDHPGICAIYEAALEGDQPYLAMRYVEGETLAALLARAREQPGRELPPHGESLAKWLAFFELAAQALHAAHAVGLVHRDVKPGNLMRGTGGEPVLLDFGLARDRDSSALSLTQSGELFGTLPYMAPELLAGGADPDPRADVYALGVTLYETVTLRRPFDAATPEALRRQIESGDALAPGSLNPWLPRSLELVLATALERDPARRYPTAAAFADELRRVRLAEPVLARPQGLALRLRRWVARHPVFGTTFALLAVGLAVALVLLLLVLRGNRQLEALREAYQAQSLSEHSPSVALHLAVEAARKHPHPEINDIVLRILDRCWEERTLTLPGAAERPTKPSEWPDVDASDRWLAVGDDRGRAIVFDLDRGVAAHVLRHAERGPTVAAFVRGGAQVLTGGQDGRVRLFDRATGAHVRSWEVHAAAAGTQEGVCYVAPHQGGRLVATCGNDGAVALLDVDAAGGPRYQRGHDGAVTYAAFDPAGTRLLTIGGRTPSVTPGDSTVRVFAVAGGPAAAVLGPFSGPVRWAAWSPDGGRIAIANDDGQARVFTAAGAECARYAHGSQVQWVGFDPTGRNLVTASLDGVVVFDLATGARRVAHGDFHDRSAWRGAFSRDGRRLAVVAFDHSVRLYDAATFEPVRVMRGRDVRPLGLRWDHAGRRLVTVDWEVRSWYAGDRPFLPSLHGHVGRVVAARFSGDGSRVLTAGADGTAREWDARTGAALRVLPHGRPLRGARFSTGGAQVVTAVQDAPPRVWSAAGATVLGQAAAVDAWFVRGDREVVAAGQDGRLRLYDAAGGDVLHEWAAHRAPIECAALHPARPWLATGGADRCVRVWDFERRAPVLEPPPWVGVGDTQALTRVFGVTFSPDGERLLASCEDMQVREWRLRDGHERVQRLHGGTPGRLAFARGGERLLLASQWSVYVGIFDAGLRIVSNAPVAHANMITSLVARPAGDLALCASKDGKVSLFTVEPPQLTSVIRAGDAPILAAEFSPDGATVVTAAADGAVRIWPVEPLPVADRFRPMRAWPLNQVR
jgi:WD40 repeat protein